MSDQVNPFAPSSLPDPPKEMPNPFEGLGKPVDGGDPTHLTTSPFVTPDTPLADKDQKEKLQPLTTTEHLVDKAVVDNRFLAKDAGVEEKPKLSREDKLKWVRKVIEVAGIPAVDSLAPAQQILSLLDN